MSWSDSLKEEVTALILFIQFILASYGVLTRIVLALSIFLLIYERVII